MADKWYHAIELVVIGLPLWLGVTRMFFVFREYPPHVHDQKDVSRIKYPRGYEPTLFIKEGK